MEGKIVADVGSFLVLYPFPGVDGGAQRRPGKTRRIAGCGLGAMAPRERVTQLPIVVHSGINTCPNIKYGFWGGRKKVSLAHASLLGRNIARGRLMISKEQGQPYNSDACSSARRSLLDVIWEIIMAILTFVMCYEAWQSSGSVSTRRLDTIGVFRSRLTTSPNACGF